MKNVALHNLGCKVNAYEMDVMQQMLQDNGYKIVPFDSEADIYIINTCTVTNIADRKSRQMLHRAKKKNPSAVVVAVGCYVQTGRENVETDESIDLAIGNNRKKDLVTILEEFLQKREDGMPDKTLADTTIPDLHLPVPYEEMQLKKTAEHTRAYMKIQDGCNQFCSYCIIPFARGRVRSRLPEDVLAEARELVAAGYQEIVLTGIHLSSYGVDFEEAKGKTQGDTLLELIGKLNALEGLKRIRLGSLEPRIITEDFIEELQKSEKICPHFHLSLQSGCDATLKRMNRRYSSGEYYEKVLLLRKAYGNPAITTDVIVGFPGETEEEFAQTRDFLEKIKFYEMHVFKYSRRKGTRADQMPAQVSDAVKAKRSEALLEMEAVHSAEYRESFVGKEIEILFEEAVTLGGKTYMVGHTKEYVKAALLSEENLSNQVLVKKAVGFLRNDIILVQ